MAKLCKVCNSVCAYLLLFLTTYALCSVNDYHHYETNFNTNRDDNFIRIDFLGGEHTHRLERRDVPIEKNKTNSPDQLNTTLILPSQNQTNGNQSQVEKSPDTNKTLADNKLSSTKAKLGKTTKPLSPPAGNNTTKITLDNYQKNLGENGTGQRKNITTNKLPVDEVSTKTPLQNITITSDPVDDEQFAKFPPDEDSADFNKTLAKHNIANFTQDNHIYYNSSVQTGDEPVKFYWIDLKLNSAAKINQLLSKSHRRAATVQLSFDFPFYGHSIKNVTIATGGFLYTGDFVHSWLAATQYIAPLMANFDTSISNESFIRYCDNGTAFTVEWEKVSLQDKASEGEFTFQTTLYQNGDIVFVYKTIPLYIKNITDDHHPVKVGLSDAYIIDRAIFLVRRKTIYEYHRINFLKDDITNSTVIYLKALPTCLQNTNCESCLTKVTPSFQCNWCSSVKRCSNGVDRHRQDWLTNNCPSKPLNFSDCSHTSDSKFNESNIAYVHNYNEITHNIEDYSKVNALGAKQPVNMGVSSIVAILFLISMVLGLAVWVLYAYRNPHTTSGQILIRYRPSQWKWRRGEARYTAATIHM